MRPADRALLLVLATALLLMALLVAGPSAPGDGGGAAGPDLPGEPRTVDMDALRRRILEGTLSDREALHYHPEPR
jgi:hypothetical protein